jgi:TonB family protein
MNNVIAYSAQVLLVVAVGALLAFLVRLQLPKARLWFWQGLLAVCLVLPFVQPRQASQLTFTVEDGPLRAGTPVKMTPVKPLPVAETVLGIYLSGVTLRAVWLLLGCWRLRRYRRNAINLHPVSPALIAAQERLATFPDIRLSSEIGSPVTFGLTQPVVLLPPSFLDLDEGSQQAIAVHELMHVARGDWMFSISEEIIRSIFWFHPAIWWLLAQIQLTREQVVDRATVEFTLSREQYLEALLAVAKTKVRPDLALAPLFLKKRHLARRVAAVMKEVRMSKRQIISSLVTVFTLALITARVAVWVFPLESSAQDGRGVTVETGGHKLLHSSPIDYPRTAREKHIEGTVFLQLSLDAKGEVLDARVESGPNELRSVALSSALQWHFANESGQPATIQASLTFKIPPSFISEPLRASTLKRISLGDMPESLAKSVRSGFPLQLGDQLNAESLHRAEDVLHEIDEHLAIRLIVDTSGNSSSVIIALGSPTPIAPSSPSEFNPPATDGVKRIRVGGNVQSAKLVNQPKPAYPPLAKQARIQGTVRYNVLIGKEGSIQNMELVSGHPLLIEAATPAVQKWQYAPTLLNGEPVEVQTVVDVNFTLSQ